MKLLLACCMLVLLCSCHHNIKEAAPYVVIKIHEDSTDDSGVKYRTVTMKNSMFKYYTTSGNLNVKVGDTIMVGCNEMGDYMVKGDLAVQKKSN